jgi:nucleotide-binding universal stress UspA family protein
MERTVVCAFDPNAGDRAPVALARLAAGILRARLVVVVVRPGGSAPERLARMEERGARGSPARLAATLRRDRAELREIAAPSPASGLHDVLAVERPALAVAGSAERAGHGHVRLGTTTERLLDGAPCPVAIAPRGWSERPLSAIAVAVVPSPEGRAALRAAAELARAARVPLRVVMVLSDSPDAEEADELARELAPGGGGTGGGAAVLQPALTSAALDLAPSATLEVVSDVFVGDPVDTLVRASKRAGLLVLGSRAYGPAEEVHAGGVARRVLAGARCPVVVVPRG